MVLVESFGPGSWLAVTGLRRGRGRGPDGLLRGGLYGAAAVPASASLLGRRGQPLDALAWALGGTMMTLMLVALEAAVGLVFDPRYREIPFAPLTAAVVVSVCAVCHHACRRTTNLRRDRRGHCTGGFGRLYRLRRKFRELAGGMVLRGAVALAFILVRVRDAQNSG